MGQCDSVELEIIGKTTTSSTSYPKLTINDGLEMPVVGAEGKMLKYFETELFGGSILGWLGVGLVKVIAVNGELVSFKLLKELSSMTINGKKASHFKSGKKMKFSWEQPPVKKFMKLIGLTGI